jgi:AraC family transcriptional regulator
VTASPQTHRIRPRTVSPPVRSPLPTSRPVRNASGLVASETRYAPGVQLAEHYHDGATLSLVFRGGYEEGIGRRSHYCEPLTLVYKPPRISHTNRIGREGLHGLFVEIAPERFAEQGDIVGAVPDAVCVSSATSRALVARARREIRERATGYELALEGLLLELWAETARRRAGAPGAMSRPAPPWLARAREYLHAHFRDSIGLTEVARAAGVHPVHLAQVFRRRHGRSVGEYVRELRIEFACRALGDRAQAVGRVALSAGFADHSHFARTFKARTGLTPSEYRRAHYGSA